MAKVNAINNKGGSLTIDPGASGDSFVQFDINATGEFRIGVDDDASDTFKISQGSALGANDTFIMTAAGERTMPLQPAFLARLSSDASNATGDGTVYTLVSDTEVFDQNGDYNNGTGTFTASVTGRYNFFTGANIATPSGGGDEVELKLVTSNRTYTGVALPTRNRAASFYGPFGWLSHEYAVLADMDAADTAYVTITSTGGAKTDDVKGGNVHTSFSGSLVC